MRDSIRQLAAKLGNSDQLEIAEKTKTPAQIEAEIIYGRLLVMANSPQIGKRNLFEQEIDYSTACDEFRKLRSERAMAKRRTTKPDFFWGFTDYDKDIIEQLIKYFINDPSCILTLHKGLWILGKPGVGKTEILQLLSVFCHRLRLRKQFGFVNLSEEYDIARNEKNCDRLPMLVQKNKCFDEFLQETGDVNSFGNKIDLNKAIIAARYIKNQKHGQLTHFISNKTPEECEQLLSAHISDRIMELCTIVQWEGESKRK